MNTRGYFGGPVRQAPPPPKQKKRVFRVTQTYEGFDKGVGHTTKYVAIVVCEGDNDLYAVDDPNDLSGLRQYLRDQGLRAEILGVYAREN
jgi:hypothetical protein